MKKILMKRGFTVNQWVKVSYPDSVSQQNGYTGKIFQVKTCSEEDGGEYRIYHSVKMTINSLPGLYIAELTAASDIEILEATLLGNIL